MARASVLVLLLVASSAHADDRASNTELVAAIKKRDDAAAAKLIAFPLKLRGLWFPTASCHGAFGQRVTVTADQVPELLECLATLDLRVLRDGGLGHDPDVRLDVAWKAGRLTSLANLEIDPATLTVTSDALDRHAKRKLVVPRDRATKAIMKANPELVVYVDVRICIAPSGKPDALEVTAQDVQSKSYRAAVEAAARKWTFKPFLREGKPIRVCAWRDFTESDGDGVLGGVAVGGDEAPPPPPPPHI